MAALALCACAERKLDADPTSGGPAGASSSASTLTATDSSEPPTPTSAASTGTEPGITTTGPADDTTVAPATTFILNPDGSGGAGRILCDVFAQDCPPGEKCSAWADDGGAAWNATKCVPVNGDQQPGEPCTVQGSGTSGIDDCAAGVMCWDVGPDAMGFCVALCTGTPDAVHCEGNTSCVLPSDGVLNLCLPSCDPLLQDCPGADLCIPNPDGTSFTCVLDASGDGGQVNDLCEFPNTCDPGLVCLDPAVASSTCTPGPTGCCQPFCEFTEGQDGACPNPDQKCVQWFDPMTEIPQWYVHVGVCRIPD